MNPRIQKDFLEALRSGKYKQCFGQLRKEDKFSTDGILFDLFLKESKKKWEDIPCNQEKSWSFSLSKEVYEWAFEEKSFYAWNAIYLINKNRARVSMSTLNDWGYSFKNIADLIEQNGFAKC